MSQNLLRAAALILVALMVAGVPTIAAAEPVSNYAAIDHYVQLQLDANHFPGVAVAIVEGESIAHLQGFGHDTRGQPVTPRTPFMIGSNSKSFAAMAIMQLVEAGQVELDAPVQRYVPAFRLADASATAQITVRQLLNQTSGIPATAAGDILLGFQAASPASGLAALRDVQLNAAPGSAYEYANANYMLLGMVIEAVSRQPYAAYVQGHILDPLQMSETRLDSGSAVGYRFWFGVPVPDPMPYTAEFVSVPTGGVTSTAEDMSHYLAMYLNGGEYQGQRLLSPAGIAEMERGVSEVTFSEGDRTIRLAYGMGWASGDIGGIPAVYHTGGSPQFSSWMVLIPSQNRAFITLTNANNWIPGPGLSSTELIPKGVMLLLAGATPDPGTSLPSMYLWIDAVAGALVLVLTWSFIRRVRRPVRGGDTWLQGIRNVGPLVWELGLPLMLLLGFPRLFEVPSWTHVMTYTPDLGTLAVLVSLLWLGTGLTRAIKLLRTQQARPEARTRPEAPLPVHPQPLAGQRA